MYSPFSAKIFCSKVARFSVKLAGATGTVIDRAGIFLAGADFDFGFPFGAVFALPILLVIKVGKLEQIGEDRN